MMSVEHMFCKFTKNTQRKNTYQTPSKLHHSTGIQTSQIHGPRNKSKHKTPKSHSHHQNSIKLIQNIKRKHIPHNSTLASFDITNYTPTFQRLKLFKSWPICSNRTIDRRHILMKSLKSQP